MNTGNNRPGADRRFALPRALRIMLAAAALVAPPGRRDSWRREWTAEILFALQTGRNPLRVTIRALWCFADALLLWPQILNRLRTELLMRGWFMDFKVAVRSFSRAPALTAVMIATLALGIGAASSIFGGAALMLGFAALVSIYLPARRPTDVDPAEVLRPQ